MAIIKNEFAIALAQVAQERGISIDSILLSIEEAVLAAYQKEHEATVEDGVVARVNRNTGETHLYRDEKDITPPGFGRIAAMTARNVVMQKIREAERGRIVDEFETQIGTLMRVRVVRIDGPVAVVDVNRTEAILPRSEQMRGEILVPGSQISVVLKSVDRDPVTGRAKVIVSRAANELLLELLKREVPEIHTGTVKVMHIERIPGERSKVLVTSQRKNIDPVGACVGQKGVRIQVITDELCKLEKIDVIEWTPDTETLLRRILAPAKINAIALDETSHEARVEVDESQASLAIGKGGVNVDLASHISKYKITIMQVAKDSNDSSPTSE